jgi:hypothetical protein
VSLVRIERSVDAAEHDPGASLARDTPHFVPPACVAGVDADADHVAGADRGRVQRFERLIDNAGIAPACSGGGGEHVQPAGRNHRDAERDMAGVDEVDASRH